MDNVRVKDNTVSDETIIELYNQGWEVKDIEEKYSYCKGGLGYRIKKLRKLRKLPPKKNSRQNMGVLDKCGHYDCIYLTPFDNMWACYYCVIQRKSRPCPATPNCTVYQSATNQSKKKLRKDLFL